MTGRKEIFQKAMRNGHSAAWDQKWEPAAEFYRQALEEFPDDAQALLSLGLALLELQDYEGAIDAYNQAARVTPDDPIPMEKIAQISEHTGDDTQASDAAMQAAVLYLNKGDADKAIENWSLITRVVPAHLMAHSRLAVTHERLGRTRQAISAYMSIASLLQAEGKKGEALQVVNHALQLDPANDSARQVLTLITNDEPLPMPVRPRVTTGSLSPQMPLLAEPSKERGTGDDLDPIAQAKKTALAELARTLFELSEEQEEQPRSRRGLNEITSGSEETRGGGDRANLVYRLRRAIDLQTQGEDEAAAEELEAVSEMGQDLPAIHFDLGFLYVRIGRVESGLRLLQRAISHADYALGARLLVGEVLVERGQLKDAALQYLQALRIADSLVVPEDQAEALSQLYEPIIAAHMEQTDDGVHRQLCNNVVELLVQPDWLRNLEKARRELPVHDPDAPPSPLAEVLTQVQSGQIVAALTSIHQHARNGFIRVAMDEAYRALDYAPTYLSLHALMGDLLIKQGRTEDAITKFTMVAKAYSARGDALRSKELFQRILQLSPMDLETRKRLITQLVASGDVEGALEEYMGLAEVYLRLAEMETARATFADAQRLAQGTNVGRDWVVKIMHAIADIDQQRLDWRRALQIYLQIKELAPGDLKARISTIDLNLKMGQEPQALQEIDNLLSYLQRSGDSDKTLEGLNTLGTMYPDNAAILERIAQMYQVLGMGVEAVTYWDKLGELALTTSDQQLAIKSVQAIIALNPPNVEDYRRLLEELRG